MKNKIKKRKEIKHDRTKNKKDELEENNTDIYLLLFKNGPYISNRTNISCTFGRPQEDCKLVFQMSIYINWKHNTDCPTTISSLLDTKKWRRRLETMEHSGSAGSNEMVLHSLHLPLHFIIFGGLLCEFPEEYKKQFWGNL